MNLKLVPLGLALAVAAPATAETVEEKIQRKEEEKWFADYVKDANDMCKSKITATWDWKSFNGKLKDGSSHVSLQCGTAVEGLKSLCAGDDKDVLESVRKGITTIQCRGLADETVFDLKGKTWVITTSVNQKRTGIRNFAYEFLIKKLN